MCELMGLCLNRPVQASFSIREFGRRSEHNADGWGIGWYPDASLAVIKEPEPWHSSKHSRFLESYPELVSAIYIAHVRHRTVGGRNTHADTHPFRRELGGREYCFAHNGTLVNFRQALPELSDFQPIGGTDSEYAFCHLLGCLRRDRVDLASVAGWQWLHRELTGLNAFGKLNVMFSDGERLYCYHDSARHKGLHFLPLRIAGEEICQFSDEELGVALKGRPGNYGFAIASEPLSPAGWQPFMAGELLVFQVGRLRFSSHRELGPKQ